MPQPKPTMSSANSHAEFPQPTNYQEFRRCVTRQSSSNAAPKRNDSKPREELSPQALGTIEDITDFRENGETRQTIKTTSAIKSGDKKRDRFSGNDLLVRRIENKKGHDLEKTTQVEII
jgi:hypothetical protein